MTVRLHDFSITGELLFIRINCFTFLFVVLDMCEPEKNIPNFLLLGVYHLANCPPKVLLDLLEEDSIPITCSSKRNTMFANRYQTE